jgi:hypothetical protein
MVSVPADRGQGVVSLVRRRGNPDDSLAALNFSHQRLQYELSQIVPLVVIVVIGLVFYLLGGQTRRESAAEPAIAADTPVDPTDTSP